MTMSGFRGQLCFQMSGRRAAGTRRPDGATGVVIGEILGLDEHALGEGSDRYRVPCLAGVVDAVGVIRVGVVVPLTQVGVPGADEDEALG